MKNINETIKRSVEILEDHKMVNNEKEIVKEYSDDGMWNIKKIIEKF